MALSIALMVTSCQTPATFILERNQTYDVLKRDNRDTMAVLYNRDLASNMRLYSLNRGIELTSKAYPGTSLKLWVDLYRKPGQGFKFAGVHGIATGLGRIPGHAIVIFGFSDSSSVLLTTDVINQDTVGGYHFITSENFLLGDLAYFSKKLVSVKVKNLATLRSWTTKVPEPQSWYLQNAYRLIQRQKSVRIQQDEQ